jgi:hypothetical protein
VGRPTDFSFADVAEKLAELHGNLFVRRPLVCYYCSLPTGVIADLLQAEICAKCGKKYYRDYEVPKRDSDEAEDESEGDEDSHMTGRSWYHFFKRRRRRRRRTFSPPDGSSTTPVTRKAATARCETRSSILVRALKRTSLPRRSPNPRKPT